MATSNSSSGRTNNNSLSRDCLNQQRLEQINNSFSKSPPSSGSSFKSRIGKQFSHERCSRNVVTRQLKCNRFNISTQINMNHRPDLNINSGSFGIIMLIVLACLTTNMAASLDENQEDSGANNADGSTNSYYQPAMIGFRCETLHDLDAKGVSVVEANAPVTLTLYGESFTTNTIVAFTTQFRPDIEVEPAFSTHIVDITKSSTQSYPESTTTSGPTSSVATTKATTSLNTAATSEITDLSTNQLATTTTTIPLENSSQAAQQQQQQYSNSENSQMATNTRRFANRRRTKSKSYDCTDYNRIRSYKLTEANIIAPNVAVIIVNLPELEPGEYYYFCLKQPPLPLAIDGLSPLLHSSPVLETLNNSNSLVWVHQGDEWWLTLKVEPPILSVANDCILIILLLFLSAVTSGLNLGLMSLDMNELAVISSCGDPQERSYARIIAPLRKRGNYLLCSLLLGNVMVNSTLTVILEEMTSGVVAVIGSTLAIVVLGEIVPQAFCARKGLAIGAKTIHLTYAFMILTFPLSYPISRLLDYVLGEEKGNVYDRERLMEFIKITGHHTQLESDEVAIISGALKLKKIKVDQIMTRIEDVFMLPIDCKLDRETIRRIIEKGYSRIPVYEYGDRKQITALILAKDLALLDPDDHTPIANMLMYCKHPLIFIEEDATLDVALNEFKTGKSHMAVVRQIYDDGEIDRYYEAIGVVTLEDVIEEVLQVEINDETDTLSDNRRKRRRTDAQVSHLFDQLTSNSSCSATPQIDYTLPLCKQVQTSLSDQLTSVSIGGLVNSLAQTNTKEQQQQRSDSTITTTVNNDNSSSDFRSTSARDLQNSSPCYESVEFSSCQQHLQQTAASSVAAGSSDQQAVVAVANAADQPSILGRVAQYFNNIMG